MKTDKLEIKAEVCEAMLLCTNSAGVVVVQKIQMFVPTLLVVAREG